VTRALSILQGRFGRVALLDMDTSLVDHAHPHYHLIFKASGPDQNFVVEGQAVPLRSDTLVAVNSWQQHAYVHRPGTERTLFLALYIEPGWLADADRSFVGCSSSISSFRIGRAAGVSRGTGVLTMAISSCPAVTHSSMVSE
jgi:AraC family transcriptional regulator